MSAQKAANPGAGLADAGGGGAKGTPASTSAPAATSAPVTVGTSTKSPVQPPVTVKTEPGTTNGKAGDNGDPAEICVVIGGNDARGGARAAQTQGMFTHGTPPPTKNTDSCIGVCDYISMCITRCLCRFLIRAGRVEECRGGQGGVVAEVSVTRSPKVLGSILIVQSTCRHP